MKVQLAYGKSGLEIEVPENIVLVEPTYSAGLSDVSASLHGALSNPIGSPPLAQLVKAGQSVAIAVCDVTRPMPSSRILPILLSELSHVPQEQIKIIVATGTHRACREDELISMLGENILRSYQVINHDSSDTDTLVQMESVDDFHFPVFLNRDFVESDVKITTGFVEPHFFAGFSGGPKLVAPGLAGLDTVMALHSVDLIGNPRSTWGIIEGNPIQKAIRAIVSQLDIQFSLDVTLNRDHEITAIFAGDLFRAHHAACQAVKKTSMKKLNQRFDIVITTNSGYPLDLNLYQSVKGMSAAAQVVKEGGVIICAAQCRDGIPEHGEYGRLLKSVDEPDQIIPMISSPGFRRQDQWQVQVQAMVQEKAQVFVKSDSLTPEEIRAALFEPVDDIGLLVHKLVTGSKSETSICILPQGPQTIPFVD